MSELPLNWTRTSLGAICSKGQYGWTTKAAGQGSVKLLRTTDITKGAIDWPSVPYCQEVPPDIDKYLVRPNDILISRAGSVGFSTLIASLPSPTVFASYLIRFVPCEHVAPKFVAYFLRSADYWHQISDAAAGIALANVNAAKLADVEIPLAPLNEQKRIADKVDVVLARVDACRERLHRVPAILKHFRQSVLAAATSGKLTEEWRNEHGDHPWESTILGACGVVTGGLTKNANRQSHELKKRYLRVANVYANRLDLSDVAEIGLTEAEHAKTRLRPDDLLIVEGNGSLDQIGRVALWSGELDDCVHQNHLIRWRPSGPSVKFVLFWLLSPQGRSDLTDLASTTTGLHTLSISKVSALPIRLPPSQEQNEIVHRVETLFAYAGRLEARYTAARSQVERLTPALLTKAFRGDLVPQDPNDEPAAVLLERIRTARAASEGAADPKRRKGGGRPKTFQKAEVRMLTRKDIQDTHLTMILKDRGPLTAEALWSASELDIDDFYDQLKDEEARGLLQEKRGDSSNAPRMLEAA